MKCPIIYPSRLLTISLLQVSAELMVVWEGSVRADSSININSHCYSSKWASDHHRSQTAGYLFICFCSFSLYVHMKEWFFMLFYVLFANDYIILIEIFSYINHNIIIFKLKKNSSNNNNNVSFFRSSIHSFQSFRQSFIRSFELSCHSIHYYFSYVQPATSIALQRSIKFEKIELLTWNEKLVENRKIKEVSRYIARWW